MAVGFVILTKTRDRQILKGLPITNHNSGLQLKAVQILCMSKYTLSSVIRNKSSTSQIILPMHLPIKTQNLIIKVDTYRIHTCDSINTYIIIPFSCGIILCV